MKARPSHLPDFESPPLNEVVLGVQFAPISGYTSVLASKVRGLFEDDFPAFQERPSLDPSSETFGGTNLDPSVQFSFGPPLLHNRLWFISEDQGHLIQFQEDRFMMNWRNQPGGIDYPRFERVADSFERHLKKLGRFCKTELGHALDINQCEVSYINIVPVKGYGEVGEWFKFIGFENNRDVENLNLHFNEIIRDGSNKPYARLKCRFQSRNTVKDDEKAIRLSLVFSGKPAGNDIPSAMDFLYVGREKIVMDFGDLTTTEAHKSWGIKQ